MKEPYCVLCDSHHIEAIKCGQKMPVLILKSYVTVENNEQRTNILKVKKYFDGNITIFLKNKDQDRFGIIVLRPWQIEELRRFLG